MGPSPDGKHHPKVVSQYCRKHHQQARYYADHYPFELLLGSLSRMEEWDVVESFEIKPRRLEILRIEEGKQADPKPIESTPL